MIIPVTRQRACSPARVARYMGKQPPNCNHGLGCPACWDKYLAAMSPLPGQFPDEIRIEMYLENLTKAGVNVPVDIHATAVRLRQRQETEYALRESQRSKR